MSTLCYKNSVSSRMLNNIKNIYKSINLPVFHSKAKNFDQGEVTICHSLFIVVQ